MNGIDVDLLLDVLADKIAARVEQLYSDVTDEPGRSPWLNARNAAAYLDWLLQRVYKLSAQGAIPHHKHDGRLVFNRQDIDHWLHSLPGATG